MITGFQLVIRAIVCSVLTFLIFWGFGKYHGQHGVDLEGNGTILFLSAVGLTCLLWLFFFGISFVHWFSDAVGGFLFNSDAGVEYQPEFSVAEARVKEKNFEEAIFEFRKGIQQFPEELRPHLRIADILIFEYRDFRNALEELKVASEKAKTAEGFAHVNFRLCEIYLEHWKDMRSAMLCLHDIQRKFPGTPQASAAMERAKKLIESRQA